jgi:hypothetical protein
MRAIADLSLYRCVSLKVRYKNEHGNEHFPRERPNFDYGGFWKPHNLP